MTYLFDEPWEWHPDGETPINDLGVKTMQNVKQEIERRKSQAQRMLELLQREVQVYTQDLEKIAFNYTMRVSELRKEGYIIIADYVKPGVFRYTFKGLKGDE